MLFRSTKKKKDNFKVNDVVYVRAMEIAKNRSLSVKWKGPYVIKDINANEFTCELTSLIPGKPDRMAHFAHLRLGDTDISSTIVPIRVDTEGMIEKAFGKDNNKKDTQANPTNQEG